jgi:hypothetical protein
VKLAAIMTTSPPTGADAQSSKPEEPRVVTISHTNIPKKTDLNRILEHIMQVILQNKSMSCVLSSAEYFFQIKDTHAWCPGISQVPNVASGLERSLMLVYRS